MFFSSYGNIQCRNIKIAISYPLDIRMALPVKHYYRLVTAGRESICVESYLPNTDYSVTIRQPSHTYADAQRRRLFWQLSQEDSKGFWVTTRSNLQHVQSLCTLMSSSTWHMAYRQQTFNVLSLEKLRVCEHLKGW